MPRLLPALLACLALTGCGGGGPAIAPVTGVVTLNDEPLADALVTTQPTTDGPGSVARTATDGTFTLRLVGDDRAGAVVGRHRVVISKGDRPLDPSAVSEEGKGPAPKETLPARYNDKTELRMEVPAGGLAGHRFDLTRP
jgi:hypothetical protein